jgi:S1-C subfamily serine protease
VYRVRNTDCISVGTSFGIDQEIVTNRHVASGAQSLQLATWDGNDFTASVRSISGGEDLAILNGSGGGSLASADPAPGTTVWAAGYPLGDQISLVSGAVIDYVNGSRLGVPGMVMRVTDPIQHGNSGGPLLDANANVVGVVFAIERSTNDGLVIPVSTLGRYLQDPSSIGMSTCATA